MKAVYIQTRGMQCLIFCLLLVFAAGCNKICESAYEGSHCDVSVRTKFEGVWLAVDAPGNLRFSDTLSDGPDLYSINISASFGGHTFTRPVKAQIKDQALIVLNQQPDADSIWIFGVGNLSAGNTLNWNYEIVNNADTGR